VQRELEIIDEWGLSDEDEQRILHDNAAELIQPSAGE
jgi:hypothetical protein